MATLIRAEISEKNKYWIDKHRHYELKHFCLQYPNWKKIYMDLIESSIASSMKEKMPSSNIPGDPTGNHVVRKAYYSEKINVVEKAAMEADAELYVYILRAVTEGLTYPNLKTKFGIPCSRDTYYDRYRRFFWLLNKYRE